MGILVNDLKLLLEAKSRGASFDKVLTLARLSVQIQRHDLDDLLVGHGLKRREDPDFYDQYGKSFNGDDLFRLLGAKQVDSMDYSDFEGASIIHDLNKPMPAEYNEQYDLVVDGGTLEHVFNFPVAIGSAMRAVKVGGRLVLFQMANNFCGHGFYSFSPELFYRLLAPKYGFQVERMLVYEESDNDRVFSVSDVQPGVKRVNLKSDYGVLIIVEARKIGPGADPFLEPPAQIDYSQQWSEHAPTTPTAPSTPVAPKAKRKPSLMHDVAWYARWQARRTLRRRADKEKKKSYFGDPRVFQPYRFQG